MYQPEPLSAPPGTAAAALAEQALACRLTVYAGAGVSAAAPTSLPGAAQLANLIFEVASAAVALDGVNPSDLIGVADRLAAEPQGLAYLKSIILRVADLAGARITYAHEVLALLICEGAVVVIETNYDDCIERGALPVRLPVVITDEDRLTVSAAALLKAHGCATRPHSMLVTSAELEDPPLFARTELAARLSQGPVAFLGIGSPTHLSFRDTAAHVALEQADRRPAEPARWTATWRAGTYADRRLSAISAAGLANNLNDAYAWALLPLLLLSRGLPGPDVALVAALYPAVWGVGQLATGALSDLVGRRPLLTTGFALQTIALVGFIPDAGIPLAVAASALLGLGTALVYPTLLATITDLVEPADRAGSVGVYRLWRDLGYVAGALVAGGTADLLGPRAAIVVVAAITSAAGFRLHRVLTPGSTIRPALLNPARR